MGVLVFILSVAVQTALLSLIIGGIVFLGFKVAKQPKTFNQILKYAFAIILVLVLLANIVKASVSGSDELEILSGIPSDRIEKPVKTADVSTIRWIQVYNEYFTQYTKEARETDPFKDIIYDQLAYKYSSDFDPKDKKYIEIEKKATQVANFIIRRASEDANAFFRKP
jgi:energy-coupling factor transporter transmembrane protein EcfT